MVSYFRRASARSRGSCTAHLPPWEKQLLLSLSTDRKDSTQHLLACVMHTDALNTDPDSCPPEVKPRPMKTIYKHILSSNSFVLCHFVYLLLFAALLLKFGLPNGYMPLLKILGVFLQGTSTDIIRCTNTKSKFLLFLEVFHYGRWYIS